jgi:protein-disulfide isomerase/uncharacterized membrane protein/rhodanese-related sulfurtransferase
MRKPIALALSLLGLFDALYLLYTYTSPSRPMVCIGTGCDAVRASAYSTPFGVPMPLFGVFGYALLAMAIVAEPLLSARLAKLARTAVLGMTAFGFVFSLYLDYLQAFKIHAYCAWCLTSGFVMTGLFALAVVDALRPPPPPEPAAQLTRVRWLFAVCVAAVAAGAPAFYALTRHGHATAAPQAASADLADRLARPDSHATGNPQAALTIVQFGDFECPVCARAEAAVREARARYASRVRFVFRQFPLERIHPFAWKAAEASECAAEQGKFWEAVEKIYSRQEDLGIKGLERDATELGLDRQRFSQCLASGATESRVRRDLEDGRALGVSATPTFFIGRKPVEGVLTAAQFDQLIAEQMSSPAAPEPPPAAAAPPAKPSAAPAGKPAEPAPAPQTAEPDSKSRAASPALSGGGFLPGPGTSAPGGLLGAARSTGASCSEADALKKQPTLIHTQDLRQLLAGDSLPLFVDVRPAAEYAGARIPGAINIPADEFERRWGALPKDRTVIFYESGRAAGDICAAGRAAGRALLEHGFPFEQVKVYQEGLAGWEASGLGKNK